MSDDNKPKVISLREQILLYAAYFLSSLCFILIYYAVTKPYLSTEKMTELSYAGMLILTILHTVLFYLTMMPSWIARKLVIHACKNGYLLMGVIYAILSCIIICLVMNLYLYDAVAKKAASSSLIDEPVLSWIAVCYFIAFLSPSIAVLFCHLFFRQSTKKEHANKPDEKVDEESYHKSNSYTTTTDTASPGEDEPNQT